MMQHYKKWCFSDEELQKNGLMMKNHKNLRFSISCEALIDVDTLTLRPNHESIIRISSTWRQSCSQPRTQSGTRQDNRTGPAARAPDRVCNCIHIIFCG